MSYILDALKKAEAERHLGTAPTLHAQPSALAAPRESRTAAWGRAWIGLGITLVIGSLGLAWFKPWQTIRVPNIAAVLPTQPTPTLAKQPQAAPQSPPRAPVHSPNQASQHAPPAKTAAMRHVAPNAPRPSPLQEASASTTLRELPAQLRHEIPALDVGGYLYSPNRAERSIVINKKLLREGEPVAPDLALEEIEPHGVILNYKGTRYRAAY